MLLEAVELGPAFTDRICGQHVDGHHHQGQGDGATPQGIAPNAPPGVGRWTRLAPVPETSEERNGVVANGKLYLFGGNPVGLTGTPPGSVFEYDPAGDKWTKKKNMPLAAHHVAVAENGGKIYVFGGGVQKQAGGGAYVPANNAWEYDPAADSWKALAAMPTPRLSAVAVAASGKIYVMGGAGNYKARDGQSLTGTANAFGAMWTVVRMNAATGEANAVAKNQNCTPDWFPDSRHIIYSSRPPGQMDADGGSALRARS